jgi:hypothetical protein
VTSSLSALDGTSGGDLDSGDVDGNRRLLSVAEIQEVLRELHARPHRPAAAVVGAPSQGPESGNFRLPAHKTEEAPTARQARRAREGTPVQDWGDTEPEGPARGDSTAGTSHAGGDNVELAAGWIAVLAAHPGAGASTVALAISDAAAADDRRVHLVDTAAPFRSGLVAAPSEELGTDATGAWRRGLRAGVTVDRPATEVAPADWPVPPGGDGPALTVVDVGLAEPENLARLAGDRSHPVVVCRPTVPGVRLTEQLLDRLARQPVAIAAVGPSRWSGEVTASLGPRLRALRAAGCLVPVPTDRRLQVTGPTSSPLPKSVRSAGRQLLELLDGSHPGAP